MIGIVQSRALRAAASLKQMTLDDSRNGEDIMSYMTVMTGNGNPSREVLYETKPPDHLI